PCRHPHRTFSRGARRRGSHLCLRHRAGSPAAGDHAGTRLAQARRRRPAGRPGRALSAVSLRGMNTTPPTACPAWKKLAAHADTWSSARLADVQAGDPARSRQMIAAAPGVQLDYSRQRAGALTVRLLVQLAAERGFEEWRSALFAGAKINNTEDRAVTHTALRSGDAAAGFLQLADAIRKENRYRRIVNLGTGGSDLGPRLLADAFGDGRLDVRFVANADPLELRRALAGADPAATLFIVVSKSFTRQETMANAAAARQWGGKAFYAVTANVEADRTFGAAEILPMPESVGGRYSVWSAAGFSAA